MDRRIARGHPLPCGEPMERPNGDHRPGCTGGTQRGRAGRVPAQGRGEVGDVVLGDVRDLLQLCLLTPVQVPLKVATVGRDSVRRQPPLDLDVSEVPTDGLP